MKKIGVLGAGLVGLAVFLGLQDQAQFFQAYLVAFLFWMAIPLGALALRLINYLTGGEWGKALNPFIEAGIRTIPVIILLFIPIIFGMKSLYPWTHQTHEMAHVLTGFKGAYLTSHGFLLRAAICLGLWLVISLVLSKVGKGNEKWQEAPTSVQGFSGVALFLYVLTMTVAITDWVMSLKPEWYSTIYGVMFMIGQGLSALSFGLITVVYFYSAEQKSKLKVEVYHDLGKLLLAFVMLWAYMNLSQFLIIWSGNLGEEAVWYLDRFKNGWQYAGFGMLILQFFLPFTILLSRNFKRNPESLGKIAVLIFFARLADLFWTVKPSFCTNVCFNLLDLILWAGIGGIWIAFFFAQKEALSKK